MNTERRKGDTGILSSALVAEGSPLPTERYGPSAKLDIQISEAEQGSWRLSKSVGGSIGNVYE